MSQYIAELSSSSDSSSPFQAFYESFYKISDTPDAHEEYMQQFTKDGILIMASKKVQGSDEILALRKSMWEKIRTRSHHPTKIFPFGGNTDEVMLYGTVNYELKDGRTVSDLPWAARAHLVTDSDGKLKMSSYQVYLDTAAQNPSK